ncbi:hypothetical protein Droror1_Dr00023478 [Drosera rotundifolia]
MTCTRDIRIEAVTFVVNARESLQTWDLVEADKELLASIVASMDMIQTHASRSLDTKVVDDWMRQDHWRRTLVKVVAAALNLLDFKRRPNWICRGAITPSRRRRSGSKREERRKAKAAAFEARAADRKAFEEDFRRTLLKKKGEQ